MYISILSNQILHNEKKKNPLIIVVDNDMVEVWMMADSMYVDFQRTIQTKNILIFCNIKDIDGSVQSCASVLAHPSHSRTEESFIWHHNL